MQPGLSDHVWAKKKWSLNRGGLGGHKDRFHCSHETVLGDSGLMCSQVGVGEGKGLINACSYNTSC